jgi:hypothetical protein
MSTLQDFGGYLGRVFDAKTLIALALIGCATYLASIRILDAAAWVSMCTTVGAFWGVGAVASSPSGMQALAKLGGSK